MLLIFKDEGEKVEEADPTYAQFEIIPPSDGDGESSSIFDGPTAFDSFVTRHLTQRFSHLNLSGYIYTFVC